MERRVNTSELVMYFDDIIQIITDNQEIVIVDQDGKPQVVMLPVEQYRLAFQERKNADWLEQLDYTHSLIEAELKGKELPQMNVRRS